MEQLGVLPSPEAVLNKLKSDGTFDQLRKSCQATIEGEPSFRAHGEHVEILTRRYLQNFKWKEKTTRNEVRAKLRSYVIGAIAKPELAVGMPLGALVEKTLEAQAKELLPKIVEKVEILRASKAIPLPDPNSLDYSNGPTTATASTNSAPEISSSKRGSDFGGLPLPIEIPGLTAPKKEAASTGGSGSDVASGKSAKSKSKPAEGLSSKDGVKVAQKLKPGGTTSGGTAPPKESVKQKEKEDKSGTDSKELSGEFDSKERNNKGTLKVKKSKEEKQRDSQENQKPQASISREKGADAKDIAKKEAGKGAQKDSSRVAAKGEPDKNQNKEAEPYSSAEASAKPQSADAKKGLPPRRRSARLASHTESKEEEATTSESEEQHSKRDALSGNKSNTSEDETTADKRQRRRKRPRPVKGTTRKRARVLRSSSEDSEQEETSESDDDEEGYESETEETVEDERPSKKVRSGRFEISRKRKRALPDRESDEDDAGPTRKSKTLKRHSKMQLPMKRRMKLSLSPVPVVTRYNRQVKPNRKYCVSEEDPETSTVEEEARGGETVQQQQQQSGAEEGSSSEKEDNTRKARAGSKK